MLYLQESFFFHAFHMIADDMITYDSIAPPVCPCLAQFKKNIYGFVFFFVYTCQSSCGQTFSRKKTKKIFEAFVFVNTLVIFDPSQKFHQLGRPTQRTSQHKICQN